MHSCFVSSGGGLVEQPFSFSYTLPTYNFTQFHIYICSRVWSAPCNAKLFRFLDLALGGLIHSNVGCSGCSNSANFFGFSAKFQSDNAEPIQFDLCRDRATFCLSLLSFLKYLKNCECCPVSLLIVR